MVAPPEGATTAAELEPGAEPEGEPEAPAPAPAPPAPEPQGQESNGKGNGQVSVSLKEIDDTIRKVAKRAEMQRVVDHVTGRRP